MTPKARHQAADSHSAAATSGGKPHKPKVQQPPRPTTKEPGVTPGQGVKRAHAEAAPAPGMSKKDKRAKLAVRRPMLLHTCQPGYVAWPTIPPVSLHRDTEAAGADKRGRGAACRPDGLVPQAAACA
jgi:hypothetical protein